MIGVYFESWSDWKDPNALAKVEADKIFLAFCDPKTQYQKGQRSFDNTGLQFSLSFQVIVDAIQKLKGYGKTVYLSVGGASYPFDVYNAVNVKWLADDLGCTGIDLDFEPINPVASQDQLIQIIKTTKSLYQGQLSVAAFAAGCLSPLQGDAYRGSMIKVLQQVGDKLDFINLMNYDGGKNWDYKAAYISYKVYYNKPIYFGLEVGPQGWGDALLTLDDVKKAFDYVATTDGFFIWAYFKSGTPNAQQVIQYINQLTRKPSAVQFQCPNCQQVLLVQKK